MKNIFFIVSVICLLCASCGSTKKTVTEMTDASKLTGTWELNYIDGTSVAFDELYVTKKPYITFDIASGMVAGNTGCNSFTGKLHINASNIDFTKPMALTRMMCIDGKGEAAFLETLKKVNTWSVSDNTSLNFISGDVTIMKFLKKK